MLRRLARREIERHRPKPLQRAEQAAKERLPPPLSSVRGAVDEADREFGIAKIANTVLNHIFPDHWSFLLGEVAMYSFAVLVTTGIYLTLYYDPSLHTIVYHGNIHTLDGQQMSEAYASVLNISTVVRAGLMVRQMHHWAAEVFIGAICIHCCRVFFTSAYRRPRKVNWNIGVTMLLLAIFEGYFGYSMTNDLLAGTGVRIGYSMAESIPFVGSYLAVWFWRGQYPGQHAYMFRFYILHVLILPLLIIGLLGIHLLLIFRQEHTQFPGKGRTEKNVVGTPLWPMFMAKTTGLFLMVAGGISLMGGLAQIDPVWNIGPYVASKVSYAAQPDWYETWIEGALREMPNWQWSGWGHTVPWNVFLPGIVLPALTFAALYAWPWIEGWFVNDREMHELVAPPRTRPAHTGIGAAFFSFYLILIIASGDDVEAKFFTVSLNAMVWTWRVAQFVVPTIIGLVTYWVCRDLQRVPPRRRQRRSAAVELTRHGSYQAVFDGPPLDGHEREPLQTPVALVQPASDD